MWRYAIPGDSSAFSIDTIYYYFDKNLLKSRFSFWKSLDSLAGSKLFKMSFAYNSKWSDSLHKILPAREILIEFQIDSSIKKKEAKYRLDSLLKRIRLEYPSDNLGILIISLSQAQKDIDPAQRSYSALLVGVL